MDIVVFVTLPVGVAWYKIEHSYSALKAAYTRGDRRRNCRRNRCADGCANRRRNRRRCQGHMQITNKLPPV